jgi:uncharacterized protein YggE
MWEHNLAIRNPFGVSVFGSALITAPPDCVSILVGVSRLEQKPADAFSKARKGAQTVADFLRRSQIQEFGSSRVSLSADFKYSGGEQRFVGYKAKMAYTLVVRDLDSLEEVLAGLIDAGANELTAVEFQTSRLKELRAQARRIAVEAAREKAQIYCETAGVILGTVLHIEDVNPNVLQGRGEGHVRREPIVDNDTSKQPLDASAINVGAAVLVGFGIKSKES